MIQSKWDEAIFEGASHSREMWKVIEKHPEDYELAMCKDKIANVPLMHLKRTAENKPILRVVFFHNNRSNARISLDRLNESLFKTLKETCEHQIEIIVPEYPLYHNFTSIRQVDTILAINHWSSTLSDHLKSLKQADWLVFIGHSIGTGFATLTAKYFVSFACHLHQLILLAPIESLKETVFYAVFSQSLSLTNAWQRLGLNLFYSDHFNYFDLPRLLSSRQAKAIRSVIIIYGTEDLVSKEAAFVLLKLVDQVVELEGIDHNGVISFINLSQLAENILSKYAEIGGKSDELGRGKARTATHPGNRKGDKDDASVQSGQDSEQDDD